MDEQTQLYDAKTDFSSIYNEADPRAYFRTLGSLDYEVPRYGPPVFERLLEEMGGREDKTVLDVCCSYGVNAAMLNYEIDFDELTQHYADLDDLGVSALQDLDREWFAARRRPDAVRTVGLDVAGNAVRYAASVGLLDMGVVADLEDEPLDDVDLDALNSVNLVTITGGIGYIGERTLKTVVDAAGDEPPWIAVLSLRWLDFTPIARSLEEVGLVTEGIPNYCVPQRRFASDEEREAACRGLLRRGLDPAIELNSDSHHAELFVARPLDAVREAPIDELLSSLCPNASETEGGFSPLTPT